MMLRPLLIAGSLVLNGTCIAVFALRPAIAPESMREFFVQTFGGGVEKPTVTPKLDRSKASAPRQFWPSLDAGGDVKTLVARLRAAGFPPEIVRAMAMASRRIPVLGRGAIHRLPATPHRRRPEKRSAGSTSRRT